MAKVLILVEDLYEDLELWYPRLRLEEGGHGVQIAGPVARNVYKGKHGYPCQSDLAIDKVQSKDFDALMVPGGFSPDRLRRDKKVLTITAEMDEAKKPIAFICHGGWVLISAKILKGRKTTSVSAIKDDMQNAGADWSDAPLVVDGNLISSRTPKDLPVFAKALLDHLG